MKKTNLIGLTGLLGVLAAVALLAIVLVALGERADITLSILGLFAGLSAFGLSQYYARRPRVRRVVFLAKSRSTFSHNICHGLTQRLQSLPDIRVDSLFPAPDVHDVRDAGKWQLERLRSLEIARADAIVVVPAFDDDSIWRDLAACVRRGTLVVCVDIKPPNQTFAEYGSEPPYFVGSDFSNGGKELGRFLASRLAGDASALALVTLGPAESWPACERGSWVVYELSRADATGRIRAIELDTWDADDAAESLAAAIESAVEEGCRCLYVFSGNDKIAVAVDRRLRHIDLRGGNVHLIGYDGTTNEDGRLIVEELDHGLATLNGLPVTQGEVAGEFVVWTYENERPHYRKRVVAPRLETFQTIASP